METLQILTNKRDKISKRIDEIRNYPKTRMSDTGCMILQSYEIQEWERLDDELGKLNAEIHKLKNGEDDEELIQLIPFSDYHVIPTYSKGGILIKGGLLYEYFKNRLIEEHDSYVRERHNKTSYKLTNVKCEITPNDESNFTSGNINIRYFIDDVEHIGTCKYNSSVNNKTYFDFESSNNKTYFDFALYNINVKYGDIGISNTGKCLLRYICAMEYRKKYKNDDCSINLTET